MSATDPFSAVAESHISSIFFAGERAYKLLKPVKTSFLDYSTCQSRIEAVAKELELNRRIARDVYLGTAEVIEEGEVVDHMIVMRRLPSDRRLTRLVDTDDFAESVRAVARTISTFHSSQDPLLDVEQIAGLDAVAKNWNDNFTDLSEVVGDVLPEPDFLRARHLVQQYLSGRAELFDSRITDGFVRDGHGDLTAEDIFCLSDGPRILDCLAFDRNLRVSDVLADIAFLAMDLDRLAGPAMSRRFIYWYCEFTNEHHPASLAHFYVAYRAHVRAKVAALRLKQGDVSQSNLIRSYHDLCLQHLERAQLQLILVGGPPGTGKSTLAAGLSDALGAMLVTSDELRKDLTGRGHLDTSQSPLNSGIYDPKISDILYEEMISRAGALLDRGESVVIDASWNSQKRRSVARELGQARGAAVHELLCHVDDDTATERIKTRLAAGNDPSDARPELLKSLRDSFELWPACERIDTGDRIDLVLAHALAVIQGRRS